MDTCIEIYKKIHHQKWYEDKAFSYFVLNYLRDFIPLNLLYNSLNTSAYKDYYYKNYLQLNWDVLENIENSKYTLYSAPSISYFQDTYNLDLYVEYKDNNQRKFGHLLINYDFDNQSIICYEFKPDAEIPVNNS